MITLKSETLESEFISITFEGDGIVPGKHEWQGLPTGGKS